MSPDQQVLSISKAAQREAFGRPARAQRNQRAAHRRSGARGAGRQCLPGRSVSREGCRRRRSSAMARGELEETAQGPCRKMGSGRAIGSHGESRTRGLPGSNAAGNRAPRLPAGRWDRTAANTTAQSMSLHLAAGSAAASARSRRDCVPDKVRQYLRGRSTYGRAASDEQHPADAGQVVPTMSRQPLRAPLRSNAAAHRWHAQPDAASLTRAHRELA
jgi:hypothetical protein